MTVKQESLKLYSAMTYLPSPTRNPEIKAANKLAVKQKITQAIKLFLVTLLMYLTIISFPLPALALTIQEVPNPRQNLGDWIVDMANLLDPGTELQLNQAISDLETDTGIEVAIVTVINTNPSPSPEYFAETLFNYWGIGKEYLNNGILLLVSKGDRRVEIRTGQGIAPLLSNAKIQYLIDTDILPQFRQGNFATGILVGTEAIIKTVGNVQSNNPSTFVYHRKQIYLFIAIAVIIASIGILIFIALRSTEVGPESRAFMGSTKQNKAPICNRCHLAMQPINNQDLLPYLTPVQCKAQEIGGIAFYGWRCPPECQQATPPTGIHLQQYIINDQEFKICPSCQEWTMTISKEVLQPATTAESGRRLIRQECCFCLLIAEQEEIIRPGKPIYNANGVYIDSVSSFSSSDSFGGGTGDGGGVAGGGW
jgi:uncharacterized protein